MGIYHLMGLGLSPGAITGPLSYLAHRYQRWNTDDQHFFSRSGEMIHRQAGQKVGDMQSIVFFTTPEVLAGQTPFQSYAYVENQPGQIADKPEKSRAPMKEVLRSVLKKEWQKISGGRQIGAVFWCEVDRRNISLTYERIVQVIAALAGVGGQGKEMWVNLTGGNNVTNFALQLAATLSGEVARLYYVQAENQAAEKCVRFTAEEGYWVELPVMPLVLSDLNLAVLNLLHQERVVDLRNLYSHLIGKFWNLLEEVSAEEFKEIYLKPMWKQGLLAEEQNGYIVGSQWELIQPYEEVLQQARETGKSLEELAQQERWIEREVIQLN